MTRRRTARGAFTQRAGAGRWRAVATFVSACLLFVSAASAQSPNDAAGSNSAPSASRTSIDEAALKEGEAEVDLLNAPGLSRGVDAIIAEIRKREVDLALREQRVAERERAVVELESMIEERATDLDRVRQEVEDRIAAWSSQGPDRVTQLADVYASMPADKAGKLLEKLDLDLAVSVLRSMKKKSSASVLSAMRADRALRLSRRILRPLDPGTDAPAARRR